MLLSQPEEGSANLDQDSQFEQEQEITSQLPEDDKAEAKQSNLETILPAKEDTLGNSDFPPLSELEKQPKLQDDDKIAEMNRKSSMGD